MEQLSPEMTQLATVLVLLALRYLIKRVRRLIAEADQRMPSKSGNQACAGCISSRRKPSKPRATSNSSKKAS